MIDDLGEKAPRKLCNLSVGWTRVDSDYHVVLVRLRTLRLLVYPSFPHSLAIYGCNDSVPFSL